MQKKIIETLKNISSEELIDLREKIQETKNSLQELSDKTKKISNFQLELCKSIKYAELETFKEYLKENIKELQILEGKVFQRSYFDEEYILINSVTVHKKTLLCINYQSLQVRNDYLNFNNRKLETNYSTEIINFLEPLKEIDAPEWFSSFITLSTLIVQNHAK
ncbi:MAG TPA: hypothetical protein PK626_00445 [Bacteroidales bacterium]|nr:hypothetical protein [Bacteroidales bacterium]